MKKYLIKFSFILSTLILVACSDDKKVFDVDGGVTAFHFISPTQGFNVSPVDNTADVRVGVTTRSSLERTFEVSVVEDLTTAPVGSYSINTSSLVVPPNSFNSTFEISANFDLLPTSGNVRLVLELTPSVGTVLAGKERIVITLSRLCPLTGLSIAGTHSYTSFDLVRGQSDNPNCTATPSGTVTWSDLATPVLGFYATSDLAFGMLQSCWGAPAQANSPSSRVRWVCNEIRAEGADVYGDSYTYTVLSVSGSEMTISWTNTYGDSGKATITREGGADWPELLQD